MMYDDFLEYLSREDEERLDQAELEWMEIEEAMWEQLKEG